MKTTRTLKATLLFALGLGYAVATFTINTANAVGGTTQVVVGSTTNAAGDAMPVVTVTAKKLTATQKAVFAVRDLAHKANGGRS
jgi:hypothetical protein